MKKHHFIIGAAAILLSACGVNSKTAQRATDSVAQADTNKKSTDTALVAELQIKDTIKAGQPVELKFTVYNHTNSARRFCKWHTPFEPLMSKYLEVKDAQGNEVNYKGPMAKRMMPPPESSYISVKVSDSTSATVDLLKAYDIKEPSTYTLTYVGQNMSGLEVKQSATFVYSK